MAFLVWSLLAIVLFVTGAGVVRCFYGRNYKASCTPGEIFLSGLCVFVGTGEAAHLTAVFMKWSVSRMSLIWLLIIGILTVASLVLLWSCRKIKSENSGLLRKAEQTDTALQLLTGVLLLSVLLQIIVTVTGDLRCDTGDMTLETVRTFLAQDKLFGANPLTGQPYEAGVPFRLKILCLPGLYSVLCTLTGLDAELLVCRIVPALVIVCSYLAYGILAKQLFSKDRMGQILMLLVVSVLFWCGGYLDSMDGFLLLHSAYKGIAIRNAVLIPFTIAMCLQKKWKTALLAILAEACMVWTLYGLGACLLVTVTLLLVNLWMRERTRRGGKACGNS